MFLIKTFILFVLVTTIKAARVKISDNVGIVGGHNIAIEDAPYMASIQMPNIFEGYNYTHFCGGTIIHERFILTAAHCIKGHRDFKVVVGTDKLDKGGEVFDVEEAIHHENFSYYTLENDVGLFKLNKSLTFTNKVKKISLIRNEKIVKGMYVEATGWGKTNESYHKASNELKQVEHPVISFKLCDKIYSDIFNIPRTTICAGELDHTGCRGDSGGPLTYKNTYQIGITSLIKRCGVYPMVYTKVSAMLPWIITTIDKHL